MGEETTSLCVASAPIRTIPSSIADEVERFNPGEIDESLSRTDTARQLDQDVGAARDQPGPRITLRQQTQDVIDG